MSEVTICPFLIRELYEDKTAVGIECQGARIVFASKHIRRNFVYPLCGSVGNYKGCLLYKNLSKAAEAPTQAKPKQKGITICKT